MKKLAWLFLMCSLMPAALADNTSGDFAWGWKLLPTEEAAAYRIRLNHEVYQALHLPDGSDLTVTDAGGQAVPFTRLAREQLTEELAVERELAFETETFESAKPADTDPLELELRYGSDNGRQLSLRAPRAWDVKENDRLVYAALIAAEPVPQKLPRRELSLHFLSDHEVELDCRLAAAENPEPATQRLRLSLQPDSRPRRYEARHRVDQLPGAWHLACYGTGLPSAFELSEARLHARGDREHGRRLELRPDLTAQDGEPGVYRFTLGGPYAIRSIRVDAEQRNLLAELTLQSRAAEQQAWQLRAQTTLSTVATEKGGGAGFTLTEVQRDRHWRLRASPALPQPPDVRVKADAGEILFLAQGEPPWQLRAGGRQAPALSEPASLVRETVRRLGPVWTLPVIEPAERFEVAGAAALDPAPEPVPWQRYLLWLVLVVGAVVIGGFSVTLLRTPEG
jgi:antitoxin component of MazEF toxin-antitoxin module